VDPGQEIWGIREETERIAKKQTQVKRDKDGEPSQSRDRSAMNLSLIRRIDGAKAPGSRTHPWGQEKGKDESYEEQEEIFSHF
jgi:hypothetical protein